jgi:hypothetical protein
VFLSNLSPAKPDRSLLGASLSVRRDRLFYVPYQQKKTPTFNHHRQEKTIMALGEQFSAAVYRIKIQAVISANTENVSSACGLHIQSIKL